jgi:hypothetical protein
LPDASQPMDMSSRVRSFRPSARGLTLLARGVAVVGFAFLAQVLVRHGVNTAAGGGGIDALAYWTAAKHVLDGQPLYALPVGAFTAYPYPPIVAQLLAPAGLLSDGLFIRLWQALEIACLVIAVGWTRAGVALLVFPPVIAEIDAGNVHLIMAAACAMVMRGHAWTVGPAAVLKFAGGALVPLAWVKDRRGLLLGAGIVAAAILVSVVLSPAAWADYASYLRGSQFPTGWYNIAENVPLPLRLGLAAVISIAAIRWVRLAPVALVLAYPIVWFHGLSTLVAIAATRVAAPNPENARAVNLATRTTQTSPAR